MKTPRPFFLLVLLLAARLASAQDAVTYQTPPKPLADLVDAPVTPGFSVDSKGDWVLISQRAANPSITELAEPELRLAGLRINPATNGPSRQAYVTGLKLRKLTGRDELTVTGLPEKPLITNVQWSPDESKIAFLNTTDNRVELYVLDVTTQRTTRATDAAVNAAYGPAFWWLPDSKTLVVKTVPATRGAAPQPSRVPTGPTVQENLGKKAQAPTYQDLLKNPTDERIFEYYATSQLVKLPLGGVPQPLGQPALIGNAEPSPDGRFILLETTHRPYSYLVTARSFPNRIDLLNADGQFVKTLHDLPLHENALYSPDAVNPGPRQHDWRADAPATLYWVEARDGGNPKTKAVVRDEVLTLDAPFSAEPKSLYAATNRFGGITWGNATTALVSEYWWQTRKSLTKLLNPSNPTNPSVLFDRSFEDRYADPGDPVTRRNAAGRAVLDLTAANEIYLLNREGASPEGDRPFVDVLNLTTKQKRRLWRNEGAVLERPLELLDAAKGLMLTSRETPDENPNYFIRNLNPKKKQNPLTQVSFFPHPYPQLKGLQKQQLRYKRADGVDLTATLYLPAGYKKSDGPLPTFVWAYPAEFKSKDAAGQVEGSPYAFNRISYWTAAAFVTMGYAILEDASIPIVGEGDKEPNDTYVEQLVASAKAAIDEGVRLGVVDSSRVGVGGHSYGAFMTANLLSHSKLFKAGIARSGAYNRTLTPFGFQNEQRTYWQAPEVYNRMSPFMNADKMKTPLLLVHGEADNNTGTFPIQSERYYNALKGMGATTRLVLLPYESHGYRARESLLHMLWEMNGWLERYVKNAPAGTSSKARAVGGAEK